MIHNGAAVILGAQEITGYNPYFQNNNFMYFTGVEVPDSILIIDGKHKESILFLVFRRGRLKQKILALTWSIALWNIQALKNVFPSSDLPVIFHNWPQVLMPFIRLLIPKN